MKKSYYFIGFAIYCISIIEVAVLLPLDVLAYSVSAAFIFVAVITFFKSVPQSLFWAILQGLCIDLLSPSPFGVYMVSSVVLVISIKLMQHTWFKQTSLLSVGVISLVSLFITYTFFVSTHYILSGIGIISINSIPPIGIGLTILGLAIECIVIGACIRILARTQKFTVL